MGRLIIIPTPVGNLQDITLRALENLKTVDYILAEDTRTSGRLLAHYGIGTPCRSFHIHNEHRALEPVIRDLKAGGTIALVSDAGTPGLSDPGFLLSRACANEGIVVECLPGATALVPAIVASGLPLDRFVFEGFLPVKKGRKTRLEEIAQERRTIALYESPHRIMRTLKDLSTHLGPERNAVVAREISKKFETYHRGTLQELISEFDKNPPKGEMVVVVEGWTKKKNED